MSSDMQVFSGHTNRVNDVAFSLDGRRLASCSTEGTVRVWDALTGEGEVVYRNEPGAADEPERVAFTAGAGLVVWSRRSGLQVWDIATRARAGSLVGDGYMVYGFAVHPAGRLVAALWGEHYGARFVRVWSAFNWAEIDRHPLPDNTMVCSLAFDPTGTTLATSVGVIDVRSGARVSAARFPGDGLAWSADGALVAGVVPGGVAVEVFEAATGKSVRALTLGVKWVQDFAFSADGRRLVAVSSAGTVRTWDARTWEEGPALAWGIGKLRCVAFSPDGTRAACGGHRGAIVVWDVD